MEKNNAIIENVVIEDVQDCTLTLKTPYLDIKTDTYILCSKLPNGTYFMDANNVDLEEIIEFHKQLTFFLFEHGATI